MEKWILSDNIKKNMQAAKQAYDELTNKSWSIKVDTLRPGEPAPVRGVFYDEENKAAFNQALQSFGDDTRATLRLYVNDLKTEAVPAPSEAATRAVNAFSLITPTEKNAPGYRVQVDNMLRAYGDNPIIHEAVRSAARKNGIMDIPPHPVIKRQQAVEDIERNIEHFFEGNKVHSLERKAAFTDGSVAFTVAMIDNLLEEV